MNSTQMKKPNGMREEGRRIRATIESRVGVNSRVGQFIGWNGDHASCQANPVKFLGRGQISKIERLRM
jgi:hypothetical protein